MIANDCNTLGLQGLFQSRCSIDNFLSPPTPTTTLSRFSWPPQYLIPPPRLAPQPFRPVPTQFQPTPLIIPQHLIETEVSRRIQTFQTEYARRSVHSAAGRALTEKRQLRENKFLLKYRKHFPEHSPEEALRILNLHRKTSDTIDIILDNTAYNGMTESAAIFFISETQKQFKLQTSMPFLG